MIREHFAPTIKSLHHKILEYLNTVPCSLFPVPLFHQYYVYI
ncbi:hypothetical protein [Moorena producens]